MSGTDLAHAALSSYACMLLSPYAMSGTDLAHGGTPRRACYAMSGTDLAYAATRSGQAMALAEDSDKSVVLISATSLRAPYEMPGTDLLYGATRWSGYKTARMP
eukprot:1856961-Rhodomonas_salina.1